MKDRLTISKGNSKIGAVPNISLTPGKSCQPGVPCFYDGCYAVQPYRQYPATREAWDGNLELWESNPNQFEIGLVDFLAKKPVERFRYHVGGDIPDQSYLWMMSTIAWNFQGTKFLAFTKKYDLDFEGIPDNLVVVLSAWPGLAFPYGKPGNLPSAWLAEDPRAPLDQVHIRCPGNCGECSYSCWDALCKGMFVIFDRH
jgi:hypothetical protein